MEHCTKKPGEEKEIPAFGPDSIELAMRLRIRDTIEALVNEELDAALGAPKPAPRPPRRSSASSGLGAVWMVSRRANSPSAGICIVRSRCGWMRTACW